MVAVVRPGLPRGGRGGLRPLGAPLHADRRGHGHRRAARLPRRRGARARSPPRFLTDEAPRYRVELAPRARDPAPPAPTGPPRREALLELLASPNVRSRAWIYERYDHLVGSRTVRRPGPRRRGAAAAARRCAGSRSRSTGRAGSRALDPRTGGALAVLEAARNVACAGGEPLGLTDCLNFGNPEKPEIAWELAEAIEGMALAAEALGIPVVSGNVSLYNETDGRAIHADARWSAASGSCRTCRDRPGPLARGRRRAPRGRARALVRRLRVPGALRGDRRQPRRARPRRPRRARRVPLARGAAAVARARRRRTAASPSRSPRRRSGAASAPSSTSTTTTSRWFGEGGGQAVIACAPGGRRAARRRPATRARESSAATGCSASHARPRARARRAQGN